MTGQPNRQLATINQVHAIDTAQQQDLAKRLRPQFPQDCDPEQALEVARVALAYGLDPFLGELIPYKGKPYLTFDGRIRIADQHPMYDGYDLLPPEDAELKALRPVQNESIWKCVVYRKDRSRPTVAYGRAGGPNERNPVGKSDPVSMAQKRAIHRALRAAFPVPIPGVDDPLSREQLKAIHAHDREAGVSDDERRAALDAAFGVESSAALTSTQASSYLDQRVVEAEPEPVEAEYREAKPEPKPAPTRQPSHASTDDDPTADWNAFWRWARQRGYSLRSQVEELTGLHGDAATPATLYAALCEMESAPSAAPAYHPEFDFPEDEDAE